MSIGSDVVTKKAATRRGLARAALPSSRKLLTWLVGWEKLSAVQLKLKRLT